MPLSNGTQAAVRDLWSIGSQHGRAPDPTPEADPWGDVDLIDAPRDEAVVVFSGLPCIEVHLNGDGEDTITIEQCIYFETARGETLALVEALLAGHARMGLLGGRFRFVRDWLQPFFGVLLVVPVAGRAPYTQRVPYQPLQRWLETLAVAPPGGPDAAATR